MRARASQPDVEDFFQVLGVILRLVPEEPVDVEASAPEPLLLGESGVNRGVMHAIRCRICGSTKISAAYRDKSLVLIACGSCSAIFPVDPALSETANDLAEPRSDS